MLRFHPIANAAAAIAYFGRTDSQGYYLDGSDLHREWTGLGASRLGLTNPPDFEQFKRLIQGYDPHTGEPLTAKLIEGRIPGWDVTASIPKGVTTALEMGDDRIHTILWEANREAMADLERYITTRVRKGGVDEDRITGNLVAFSVEHPETRPAKSDNYPDWDRHIHNVIVNVTWDQTENEWKAIKFRPIMDLRKYFDRRFDLRLSTKLAELGYEIETKYKPDEKGGKRYFSWDIRGIPESVIKKNSRRSGEIDELTEELGVRSAVGKDKLGATSRSYKRKDLTLADLRQYWRSKITSMEGRQISETILRAMAGRNPRSEPKASKAVAYALQHSFERQSVVDWHDLAVTAMERAMGGAKPEEIEPEARKQGALFKDGLVTTREVLDQERRVVAWAREGRGTERGLAAASWVSRTNHGIQVAATGTNLDMDSRKSQSKSTDELSDQQLAAVRHLWNSPDRVILIRGGAGTGKTHMMRAAIAGIDKPVVVLAPSSDASRGVLRKEGFKDADTLAKFLMDEKLQETARNGVIWVDEAGQVSMRQLDALFKVADSLDARVVLQGDKKQHGAIERGATLRVLEEFAGLPVAELTDIRRQKGDYKAAIASIQKGDILGGYDKLASMGWIRQVPVFDHNQPLVDDYMGAVERGKSVLVVAPTHAEGDEITAEIRKRLKETPVRRANGDVVKDKDKQPVMRLGADEKVFDQLVPLRWTEAEKGDRDRYDGSEVVEFVRNAKPYKTGERIDGATYRDGFLKPPGKQGPRRERQPNTGAVAVYGADSIGLASGDQIRVTAKGMSKDGHRLETGATYAIKGFRESETGTDIVLSNDWVLDGSKALHIAHAYVSTSHAAQGKTVDRVLVAMGGESRPAINAEQFYVSLSRGRESATIYTSLSPAMLREAIQKTDTRMTAMELMQPPEKEKRKNRMVETWKRITRAYRRMIDRYHETKQPSREREYGIER